MKTTTSIKQWTRSRLAYALAGALLGSGLLGVRLDAAFGQSRPIRGMDTLLVVDGRGGIGSTASLAGQIITVEHGQVTRVVTRGLQFPYQGGLAPAPNGASVIFGNEAAGVWSVRLDGTGRRRLVSTPRSTAPNVPGVEHVVRSAQGRVAFAVNTETDVIVAPTQDLGFGIWVTPLHAGSPIGHAPRRVASLAQLPAPTASIGRLAWSRDGQRLVLSPTSSAVLALDIARGTMRALVRGGWDPTVSPVSGDLAYVSGGLHPGAATSLWTAGVQGRHRRLVLTAHGSILHPVWSPDGREIAYIGSRVSIGAVGGTAIHVVAVATGIDRVILRADRPSRFLLQHGYFADLAWLPSLQR